MLVINGEIDGRPGLDVRVDAERILQVGPGLARATGESVLDARGGAVLPGLHDHHVHLRAAAAANRSLRLDQVSDPADFDRRIRAAVADRSDQSWLRGVGWHEPTAGTVDRARLDTLAGHRPVRLQHRGGALWVLNTRALAETGALTSDLTGVERDPDGVATGRLWRLDGWLRERIGTRYDPPGFARELAGLSAHAAQLGVTGFTDATPDRDQDDVDDFTELSRTGAISQRLVLMAPPGLARPPSPRVRLGVQKLILDDVSLPVDLGLRIAASHAAAVPVAIHCVTPEQLVVAVAALEEAGPLAGDRIEHAAVVPPGYASQLHALGVAVVTQPGFIAERGDDYRREVAVDEQPWLYPCGSLRRAGVSVAVGTDLPFGPDDPWLSIVTACSRRTRSGVVLGPDEHVEPAAALRLFLADPLVLSRIRRVAVGEPGDLCVLERPLNEVLTGFGRWRAGDNPVRAVVMAGSAG